VAWYNESMRIWHQNLIPHLCNMHLVAMWREMRIGLFGILDDKNGWRNHSARKEFEDCPDKLWDRMMLVKQEADKRGLNFKAPIPPRPKESGINPIEWQSYKEQVEILKQKSKDIVRCKCVISN